FVNKFIYGMRIPWTNVKFFELREPRRGEVIVFVYPCDQDRDYIKRVIALGGDTVEVRCNVVYVNGKAVPSELLEGPKRCTYYDYPEDGGPGDWKTCSRYRETVNGHYYDTFHDPDRPKRDREIAEGNPPPGGDSKDFPQRANPFPPSCSTSGEPTK